jgi:hypothetical protein
MRLIVSLLPLRRRLFAVSDKISGDSRAVLLLGRTIDERFLPVKSSKIPSASTFLPKNTLSASSLCLTTLDTESRNLGSDEAREIMSIVFDAIIQFLSIKFECLKLPELLTKTSS